MTMYQRSINNRVERKQLILEGFICSNCTKIFKTQSSLKEHNYIVHERRIPFLKAPKLFQEADNCTL
uniref:Serendipity locus protein H1like [Bombyx mori] n=1 Tax=Lepeophtheirus salmonis TaxID=72036 RepID=A0A0K2VE75_LEPSM